MIYSIIGYWLILVGVTYLNLRLWYVFSNNNWNWKYYKENSNPGVTFLFTFWIGIISFSIIAFIEFTEWWFDMPRTFNIW